MERFIFEAASISQLFCHQIVWNMRSNLFKDDNAEVVSLRVIVWLKRDQCSTKPFLLA